MKLTLAGVLAFIGILYVVLVPAQGLQTPAVKFLPAQGYSPDTVVVRAALHDDAVGTHPTCALASVSSPRWDHLKKTTVMTA